MKLPLPSCASAQSPLIKDLHIDPVRILDVQAGIRIVLRGCAALSHIAHSGFLAEARYPDRKVVHNSGGALTIERDQRPVGAEADDSERLVLADHGEAEHLLIEFGRALQIRNLDADMVDLGSLEIDVLLGGGGRSARSQQRETSNQLSPRERSVFEASHKIGNDRFHVGLPVSNAWLSAGRLYDMMQSSRYGDFG